MYRSSCSFLLSLTDDYRSDLIGRDVSDDGQNRPEVNFPALEDFDFSYAVKDEASGNNFSVNESNKGGAYRVLLPDGRTQVGVPEFFSDIYDRLYFIAVVVTCLRF